MYMISVHQRRTGRTDTHYTLAIAITWRGQNVATYFRDAPASCPGPA